VIHPVYHMRTRSCTIFESETTSEIKKWQGTANSKDEARAGIKSLSLWSFLTKVKIVLLKSKIKKNRTCNFSKA